MSRPGPALYFGTVTHHRLRPVRHHLSYDVAAVLLDVDQLAARQLPGVLSYNRPNLFAIYDKDHGDKPGESIRDFAWRNVIAQTGAQAVTQIWMLCYPRILGYGFNPLTTYFACDDTGEVRVMIYEVHNTFGGRHAYVTGVFPQGAPNHAKAEKVLRVSPFNRVEGTYTLRATSPGETVALGVALTTSEGPLLNAYFAGRRRSLNNTQLARVFFGLPWMSLKVISAIHWEALKLWKKGLNLQRP
jgi:uncharacterized protein